MKSLQFRKVLLAEDNLELLDTLKAFFDEKFETVNVAVDGAEAYINACQGEYDLIFSDINMPGMTGIDFATRLRAEGHLTPIILTSSTIDDKVLLKALRLGVNEFVEKPYTFESLNEALSRVLEMVRRQRAINQLTANNMGDSDIAKRQKKMLGLLHAVSAEKKKAN